VLEDGRSVRDEKKLIFLLWRISASYFPNGKERRLPGSTVINIFTLAVVFTGHDIGYPSSRVNQADWLTRLGLLQRISYPMMIDHYLSDYMNSHVW